MGDGIRLTKKEAIQELVERDRKLRGFKGCSDTECSHAGLPASSPEGDCETCGSRALDESPHEVVQHNPKLIRRSKILQALQEARRYNLGLLETAVKIERVLEPQKKSKDRKSGSRKRGFWEQQYANQREWIKEHGGNLAGYISRYGDPEVERADGKPMFGDGGTAIYRADLARLEAIDRKLGK